MAQGYYKLNQHLQPASFDYFFRKNPFEGGYAIFCGLENLIEVIENLHFDTDVLRYFKDLNFETKFIEYLSSFKFRGNIYAPHEGEIVFANEPIIRIEGTLIECQLIETVLLNLINFQTLIATKASRIKKVCGDRTFLDFGLRRAQGWGGIHASRAAAIGGANASSNMLSGYYHGLKLSGTMGHSWIQSFEREYLAFEEFAKVHNGKIVLLVDTYDTLKSGIPNVIKLANSLKGTEKQIHGIRLDSGDLAYLSKHARRMLNEAGFSDIKIFASNQLDEYLIRSLNEQEAPIDGFGVGTSLITAYNEPALDGVYKL
ncbi:UNVERIFIED_CONTAM: hypothetical protein GTU68_013874, partial [Idotea baltica]|nr:hypothetical protein [Idotea baltica]